MAIPDPHSTSLQEFREFQQREHLPCVVKRIILLYADTSGEYWWYVPDHLLLAEDVELLN